MELIGFKFSLRYSTIHTSALYSLLNKELIFSWLSDLFYNNL